MRIIELNETTKNNIMENLLKRSPNNYESYIDVVDDIIKSKRRILLYFLSLSSLIMLILIRIIF